MTVNSNFTKAKDYLFVRGGVVPASFVAAATMCGITTASAAPPPGPRVFDPEVARWYHALTVPDSKEKIKDIKQLLADKETDDFMNALGEFHSDRVHCCHVADCRPVYAEKKGGGGPREGWVATLPEGAFPNSETRMVQIPSDAVILDTSNLPGAPSSAVLCASQTFDLGGDSPNYHFIYCFTPPSSGADADPTRWSRYAAMRPEDYFGRTGQALVGSQP